MNKNRLLPNDVDRISKEVAKDGLSHQRTIDTKGNLIIDGRTRGQVKRRVIIPQNPPKK